MRRLLLILVLLSLSVALSGADCQPCEDPSQLFCP